MTALALLLAGLACAQQGVLTDDDRAGVEALRRYVKGADRAAQERDWGAKVWPTVKARLIALFEADSRGEAKIALAAFVPPGQVGADNGLGPSLHIVKMHETRGPGGALLRTYVNEAWPLSERTGGLLPPDAIRVRLQAFSEDGKSESYVTDLLGLAWGPNADGTAPTTPSITLYRQRLYGRYDAELGLNEQNRMRVALSSPSSCRTCHVRTESRPQGVRTRDDAFFPAKPLAKHPAGADYLRHLKERGAAPEFIAATARALSDPKRLNVPGIVETLRASGEPEWLDADVPAVEWEAHLPGTYREEDKPYRSAAVERFRYGPLLGIGDWWHPDDLELVPGADVK